MPIHKIHHLDCGTMCPLAGSLMGSPGHFWQRGHLVSHCLLVESDDGLILIDTGMGTDDLCPDSRLPAMYRFLSKPPLDGPTALSHVLRLGYSPGDVRHILVTHLDLDHAGGISDFPNATVHILDSELRAAENPAKGEKMRYVRDQWENANWQEYSGTGGDDWFGFTSVRPVTALGDELAIIPLPGHSPGHCGIAIRGPSNWFLHAGDAFFHRNDIGQEKTPWGIRVFQNKVDSDRALRIQNTTRLRELHATKSSEVTIFCSHDPIQLEDCINSVSR